MSRNKFECFTCRDNGFPGVLIFLAGKDAQGKAIRVEEDGSAHVHKSKTQQLQQKEEQSLFHVSDESVQKGITAFSMMTEVIRLLEQTQKQLITMDQKLDRLLLNLAERK